MDFIPEPDVTPERLLAFFADAGIPAQIANANCLIVRPGEAGEGYSPNLPVVVVEVNTEARLVRLVIVYAFRDTVTPDARRAFANRLSSEMILCRFFVHADRMNQLISDCAVSYEGGLATEPFMATFRTHTVATATGVDALDADGQALQ